MKMACNISLTSAFVMYFLVGISGYAAKGNGTIIFLQAFTQDLR